jgi:hypothetical protein
MAKKCLTTNVFSCPFEKEGRGLPPMQSKARLYSGSESVRDLASEPMRVTSSANSLTLGQSIKVSSPQLLCHSCVSL